MKNILKYSLFFAIGLALLWYASKDADTSIIMQSVNELNWFWVFASMALSYFSMMLRGWRWNILLDPLGYKSDTWTNIHSVAFGYFMNNLLPRSGELARCGLLNRAEHIPVDKLFGTVILERVVDMIILVLVIGIATLVHRDELFSLFGMIDGGKGTTLLILAIIGVVGLAVFLFALKKLSHIPFIARIAEFFYGIGNGLRTIFRIKNKIGFILSSLAIWMCWILMSQTMMYAIPMTAHMELKDTIFFVVAGSLGMLIPTQGGIGSYHFMSKISFEALGYTAQAGLTFAWISWVAKTILEMVVGGIGFLIVTTRKIKAKNQN